MLHVEVESPSPPSTGPSSSTASAAALAALSRNASVISSSSSSSSTSSLLLNASRPRPLRTFSSPRNRSPAGGPPTPTRSRAPPYLSKELSNDTTSDARETPSRTPANKSRSNSAAGRLSRSDFEFGEELGSGSYSEVMSAVYLPTGKAYAIKIIDKAHLVRKQMVEIATVEKNVLTRLTMGGHPGIVKLYWAFQDQWHLYFVLDLVPKGELQSRISRLGSICLDCARWYTAQIIDATAWMHEKGVLHRDLKPENILLDDDMRIKITDFGSAKILEPGKEEGSNSWVGTPQYVPPELLNNNVTCKSSDYWAIGCILFQMISGHFPFNGASNYLMWSKIKSLDYSFPEGFDDDARDLVQKFLVLDPETRMGAGKQESTTDVVALKAHLFFKSISWDTLWSDPVPPLEAGIVQRAGGMNGSNEAFDVGAEWDRLVGAEAEEEEEDVEEYADDAAIEKESSPASPMAGSTAPIPVRNGQRFPPSPPVDVRDSTSSSGGSTASGSPPDKLGGILESLSLSGRSRRASTTSAPLILDPTRWMPLLRPSEAPVFSSIVYKAPRRTFPRQLLPLTGSAKKALSLQGKDKPQLLVLTRTRLLCLKERDGSVVVKREALIGGEGSGNGFVTGVEEKGENSFVVQTASKSCTYMTEDSSLTSRWIKELGDALPASLRSEHHSSSEHS